MRTENASPGASRYDRRSLRRTHGTLRLYDAVDRLRGASVAMWLAPRMGSRDHLKRGFDVGMGLSHPGVLRYLDFVTAASYSAIVSECVVKMCTLADLPPPHGSEPHVLASRAFRTLYDALNYLHGRGLVHANLKPDRILVDDSGQSKIADLGHCVGDGLDDFDGYHGTPAYSSPEHFQDSKLTPAADFFVFGVLFVEYLVRQRLFKSASVLEIVSKVSSFEPQVVVERIQACSSERSAVLQSLMAPVPSQRTSGWKRASILWTTVDA